MTTPDPTPEDVTALADVVSRHPCNRDADNHLASRCPTGLAILASDWLAQRDARIRAEALREAAADVPMFEFMLVMDIAAEVAPAQIAGWLRDRADRAERGAP